MGKRKSELQRAIDDLTVKVQALLDARAALEATQTAIARVKKPKATRKPKTEAAA